MIAAAPFDWIPTAVAAGTLGLGSILTMVAQGFTDRRARKREIIARRDQLRIQLYQEDREVLHGLQQVVVDMQFILSAVTAAHRVHEHDADMKITRLMSVEQVQKSDDVYSRLATLFYKCRSDEVTDVIEVLADQYRAVQVSVTHREMLDAWKKIEKSFVKAHQEIGAELKKSPLDDLGRHQRRFLKLGRKDR